MNYYIIAGEASGDLHASNMMRWLKQSDKQANFRCWGGELMQEQGGEIIKHYRDLAFMGFVKVVLNIRTILRNMDFCKQDILQYKPDVLILVDYPGFNLRIAEFAKKSGIKVFYYISPTIWAWHQSRIKTIKKYVDKMFVILPFEKDYYKRFNYEVDYCGNPLMDALAQRKNKNQTFSEFIELHHLSDKPIIALLAGSRKQEISNILPVMLNMVQFFPNYQFIIAGAPSIEKDFYFQFTQNKDVRIVFGQTYELLQQSKAALVTSGTATLETALLGVPEVVCYKLPGGQLSYNIIKSFLHIRFISLVNLIADKEIVRELINHYLKPASLKAELEKLLTDTEHQIWLKEQYKELNTKMGSEGASQRLAELIVKYLKEK